jgi:hypothetical protein
MQVFIQQLSRPWASSRVIHKTIHILFFLLRWCRCVCLLDAIKELSPLWSFLLYLVSPCAHKDAPTLDLLCDTLTDTWCYVGSTLLVSLGTPVARHARDAIFARTLPRRLITGLPRGANWVAITSWKRKNSFLVRLWEHACSFYRQQHFTQM